MQTFNIRDFGAISSDALQTEPIQKAIDECFLSGGGRVVIPCGIYLTGDLRIRSGVELYLESGAILQGSRNYEDYFHFLRDTIEPVTPEEVIPTHCPSTVPTSRWCNGLIRAFDAHNIAIVGEKGSYIDGVNCYDPKGEQGFRGPHGMCFWRCKGIRLEGYTFANSANWCHAIFQSQDITIRNIQVLGGHDGVDIRTCDNVLIETCNFNVGDDAVAGFDDHDVIIRDCVLNTGCHALRLGGNHILVENCKSDNSGFGHRRGLSDEAKQNGWLTDSNCRHEVQSPFNYYCDFRAQLRRPAEDITIKGCTFANSRDLIRVEYDGMHRWCCNRALRQIKFEDCSVENLSQTGMIWADENEKITCHYKNVKITCQEGYEDIPLLVAGNFDKIIFEDCIIEGYTAPEILVATDGKVEIIRSTPIKVRKATFAECIQAHPHGITPEDLAALLGNGNR